MNLEIPHKMHPFVTERARFKVAYGGRGSSKSWSVARILLAIGSNEKKRILCAREFQKSIEESVHFLLSEQIWLMKLGHFYTIQNNRIVGKNGTTFTFTGLKINPTNMKSYEGVDIVWIEEGENVSSTSWDILIPTIRKEGSEIWITYNPKYDEDFIHTRFVINPPPPNSIVIKINYNDNPWFPQVLRDEMEHCKATDTPRYLHIWEGETEKNSEAQIFYGKWVVKDFDISPPNGVYYHGLDFGSAADPNVLIRCFIIDNVLFIDRASFSYHLDLEDMPEWLIEEAETTAEFTIRCDDAATTQIRYLRNAGFDAKISHKGAGNNRTVKNGIDYLKSFDKIVIHESLTHFIEEARKYSWKVDDVTGEILPIIVDRYNHGWDSLRYAISKFIIKGVLNESSR